MDPKYRYVTYEVTVAVYEDESVTLGMDAIRFGCEWEGVDVKAIKEVKETDPEDWED